MFFIFRLAFPLWPVGIRVGCCRKTENGCVSVYPCGVTMTHGWIKFCVYWGPKQFYFKDLSWKMEWFPVLIDYSWGTLNKFSTTKTCAASENSVVPQLRSKRGCIRCRKSKASGFNRVILTTGLRYFPSTLHMYIRQDRIQGTNEIEGQNLTN